MSVQFLLQAIAVILLVIVWLLAGISGEISKLTEQFVQPDDDPVP